MPMTLLTLLALGCTPGEITIQGTVLESRHEGAGVLDGGTIAIRDRLGEAYGVPVATGDDGSFKIRAPGGQIVHAVVEREGDVLPTSFAGVSGLDAVLTVDRGTFYGFQDTELAEWESAYAGCPGVGEGGAMIGEVRLYLPAEGDLPIVTNAVVAVIREDLDDGDPGRRTTACYVDGDGDYDERLTQTGPLGQFGMFGLAEGPYTLVVGYEPVQDQLIQTFTEVYLPEEGVVPSFPAWVELLN